MRLFKLIVIAKKERNALILDKKKESSNFGILHFFGLFRVSYHVNCKR
jgi:hypothetical protein